MMITSSRRSPSAMPLLAVLMLVMTTACQSPPVRDAGVFSVDKALPGEIAKSRYAYLSRAISDLQQALGTTDARLETIPFSESRFGDGQQARALAKTQLIDAGPYTLHRADTHRGRIEFRSTRSDRHLSVTVKSTEQNGVDRDAGYEIVDMFGQVSLVSLIQESTQTLADGEHQPVLATTTALRRLNQEANPDAATLLAYYDSIPGVEREREDILRTRTVLCLRLGKLFEARDLIQQGIVRYPETPSFFVLAEHVFEQIGKRVDRHDTTSSTMTSVLQQRFDRRTLDSARKAIYAQLTTDLPIVTSMRIPE